MHQIDEAKAIERAFNPELIARRQASQAIQILKPFSRGIYNRGNMMEQRFQRAYLDKKPIQVIGFWGVGDKKYSDRADILLLDDYEIIKNLVKSITQNDVEVNLILADSHGLFNGYSDFEGYYSSVDLEARRRNLNTFLLSQLYREWGIVLPEANQPINPDLMSKFKNLRQSAQLIESATKHSRNSQNPEEAAFLYWLMRNQEAEHLSRSFTEGVLFVNGSKDLGMATLPRDMPHIYSRFGPVWFQ